MTHLRFITAALSLTYIAAATNAYASGCNREIRHAIRMEPGNTCWRLDGRGTNFVGTFKQGQVIRAKASGEFFTSSDGRRSTAKKWATWSIVVGGPKDFFESADEGGTLQFTVPLAGKYEFSVGPCAIWGNRGKVEICADPIREAANQLPDVKSPVAAKTGSSTDELQVRKVVYEAEIRAAASIESLEHYQSLIKTLKDRQQRDDVQPHENVALGALIYDVERSRQSLVALHSDCSLPRCPPKLQRKSVDLDKLNDWESQFNYTSLGEGGAGPSDKNGRTQYDWVALGTKDNRFVVLVLRSPTRAIKRCVRVKAQTMHFRVDNEDAYSSETRDDAYCRSEDPSAFAFGTVRVSRYLDVAIARIPNKIQFAAVQGVCKVKTGNRLRSDESLFGLIDVGSGKTVAAWRVADNTLVSVPAQGISCGMAEEGDD